MSLAQLFTEHSAPPRPVPTLYEGLTRIQWMAQRLHSKTPW